MIFDKDVHHVQRIKHNYFIIISNQMVDCTSIITAGLSKVYAKNLLLHSGKAKSTRVRELER